MPSEVAPLVGFFARSGTRELWVRDSFVRLAQLTRLGADAPDGLCDHDAAARGSSRTLGRHRRPQEPSELGRVDEVHLRQAVRALSKREEIAALRLSSAYDDLAHEYYHPRHVTSRNFEAATLGWTREHGCPIPDAGLVLDIGSGRGSVARFCQLDAGRIVEGDIALSMLAISPQERTHARVACDALSMPFTPESFAAVTAFLFDPFNRNAFLAESFRVLARGGVFFGTLPHYKWGTELRPLRAGAMDLARFVTRDGGYVDKPSYLTPESGLEASLTANGYQVTEMHALTLPRTEAVVSPDISDPAQARGVSAYEFPIVQLVVARKL